VELQPRTRTYNGFEWKGSYYFYNCLPFGLATELWVFSKAIRELVIYWRKGGINVLPYLDDFFFSKKGRHAYLLLCRRVRKYLFDAGLIIHEPMCNLDPALCLRQLGFDVDMGDGEFRVPVDRWEALQSKTDAILAARGGGGAGQKALKLDGPCDFHETGMGSSHLDVRTALVCLDKLGVLLELLGGAHGGSEVRTAFPAATAAPPL